MMDDEEGVTNRRRNKGGKGSVAVAAGSGNSKKRGVESRVLLRGGESREDLDHL